MKAGQEQPDTPEAWLEVYGDHLYGYAMNRLKDRHLAEDVVQDVMVKLWQHLSGLEAERVKPWLLRVTRNACLDLLRRRRYSQAYVSQAAGGDAVVVSETPLDRLASSDAAIVLELVW